MRNLKDTLVSLHHFRGVPKDGWYGNEHGPGSLQRWIDLEHCPNAYGNAFDWVKMSADAVKAIGPERALGIYYEALKSNFDAQLRRINDFLGLPPLTEAKARAIRGETSAEKMKTSSGGRFKTIIRKATVRDWTNYLEDDDWAKVDRTFNKVMYGVELAEPMRFFQFKDIPGMPPLSLKECDLDTDPMSWPPYLLVSLREGMIVPDVTSPSDVYNIAPTTQFKSTIRPGRYLRLDETCKDGSPRFHLFVAGSCPLASSVAATRSILGIESLISMDVADGQSGAGWVFLNGATCSPWKEGGGPFWLHEAYQLADPLCTTQIKMPVLWDTETQKIVSNDFREIMKILCDAASDLGLCSCPKNVLDVIATQGDKNNIPTLFPEHRMQAIEQMFTSTVLPLFNAVLRAGFVFLQNGQTVTQIVLEGRAKVFALLEELEEILGDKRYLLGDNLTAVDVSLASSLLQFDACYWDLFHLKGSDRYKGPILISDAYPNLKAYTRKMYQLMKPAVHFESFRQLYRIGPAIEFTHRSYLTSAADYEISSNGLIKEEDFPDLHKIKAALERSN